MKEDLIKLGYISGSYGTNGYAKIFSFTRPITQIANYKNWILCGSHDNDTIKVIISDYKPRKGGKSLIVKLQEFNSKEDVAKLHNYGIYIQAKQLPKLQNEHSFYWRDLLGLQVINLEGNDIGLVVDIIESPMYDILKTEKALIPFKDEIFIKNIDLHNKVITVDFIIDD